MILRWSNASKNCRENGNIKCRVNIFFRSRNARVKPTSLRCRQSTNAFARGIPRTPLCPRSYPWGWWYVLEFWCIDMVLWQFGENKMCVYCNPGDPLYNSPSVNLFPHFPKYIHKTKQKLTISHNEIKKSTRFVVTVANFSFLFLLWIQICATEANNVHLSWINIISKNPDLPTHFLPFNTTKFCFRFSCMFSPANNACKSRYFNSTCIQKIQRSFLLRIWVWAWSPSQLRFFSNKLMEPIMVTFEILIWLTQCWKEWQLLFKA